jgi:hypothetical protein
MFHDTLDIKLPDDLQDYFQAILSRHDVVNRNGRKIDGTGHLLKDQDAKDLIENAESVVNAIETKWAILGLFQRGETWHISQTNF